MMCTASPLSEQNRYFQFIILVVVISPAPLVTATSSCANLLVQATNTSGIIESTINNGYYSDNMDCQWNISSNAMLEIAFFSFKIHSSDYVTVYDGGSPSSPLVGRFSGNALPAPIISSSNKLYVVFVSDGSSYDSGFRARYRGTMLPKI